MPSSPSVGVESLGSGRRLTRRLCRADADTSPLAVVEAPFVNVDKEARFSDDIVRLWLPKGVGLELKFPGVRYPLGSTSL